MSTPVEIQLEGVTREFGPRRARYVAVEPLDLRFATEHRIGVVGESGSGKSTLARILVGLDRPTAGTVWFEGDPLDKLLRDAQGRIRFRRAVQFVAQDTTSSFDPLRTLLDSLVQPLRQLQDLTTEEATATALETITELGLREELAHRRPAQVSGGQRQRFALARCLVVRPRLLICDEVVSALDVSVQGAILNLLKRYCAEQDAGLLFVSHGLPATAFIADELMVMHHGAVVERGSTARILAAPDHSYTRGLLAAHEVSAPAA